MELHNRVREERVRRDLTQVSLADAVGVTRQTIIAIEKGKFVPSVKLSLELAGFLGLPLESLFWLEETK
ncbi:MAG: helix-turn-helix transcriptional regulator [Anaerolineae bacterium]|nr:helix-turn-helix transcriptional regulator [Anaerolineae bacterium]